jgi:hypothetical protein
MEGRGRRLAIRAARFDRKPTPHFMKRKGETKRESQHQKIEGPIRISLYFLLFLFNALAFPGISSKSLKFHMLLFSIPTVPSKHPSER